MIESKRKRTQQQQTARFAGQDEAAENSEQSGATKPSSPEDGTKAPVDDSSSPEKQEMSSEFDYSYDGDSDMVN